jgi:hypothetical protein
VNVAQVEEAGCVGYKQQIPTVSGSNSVYWEVRRRTTSCPVHVEGEVKCSPRWRQSLALFLMTFHRVLRL